MLCNAVTENTGSARIAGYVLHIASSHLADVSCLQATAFIALWMVYINTLNIAMIIFTVEFKMVPRVYQSLAVSLIQLIGDLVAAS